MAQTKLTRGGNELTQNDWKAARIDPASLPASLNALYTKVVEANKAVAAAQQAFETETGKALAGKLPKGRKLFFSYRFGRLCILDVDASAPVAPTGLFA